MQKITQFYIFSGPVYSCLFSLRRRALHRGCPAKGNMGSTKLGGSGASSTLNSGVTTTRG